MATVHIVLAAVKAVAVAAPTVPLPNTAPSLKETITPSGTSQATTIVAPADVTGLFWSITASGQAVWVRFAGTPVAAAGSDWLIADGQTREFGATATDKVAVINAS